jgi:hypothetical protein
VFEIGNSLREARVRQQLELAEVELATKIRARYLRALEEESFDVLPAQTYVKGFLRTYADYLGLDGQLYGGRRSCAGSTDMSSGAGCCSRWRASRPSRCS